MFAILRLSIILLSVSFAQVSTANGGKWASHETNGYRLWSYDPSYFDSDGKPVLGRKGHWYIRILFEESQDFLNTCQKNGKIYIFGRSANGYPCSIAAVRKFTKNPKEDEYTISVDISKDPLQDLSGAAFFSTNVIPSSSLAVQTISPLEIEKIASLIDIKKIKKESCCKYKWIKGLSNSKINSMRYEEEGHTENYYLKAQIRNKIFYIVPAAMVDDGQSNRIISSIFINDGSLRNIGFVDGEYNYVGPDIDQDGFPEAVFGEGNSEGGSIKCIKIYPKIETLLQLWS